MISPCKRYPGRRAIRGEHAAFLAAKQQAARQGEERESFPQASIDENRIVLNRAGSIALSLISLRKELETTSADGCLSAHAADNLLNVCQTLGFAEPLVRFVLGEANL